MNHFFLASLLSVLFLGFGHADVSKWGNKYKCQNGTRQSPIDIRDSDAVYDASKADVMFNWTRRDDLKSVKVGNDGETAYLTFKVFKEHIVLNSVEFFADVMNVHWCCPGQKGSEHAVDGVKYDGEIEIFYLKENFTTYGEGSAMVVSIFLEEDKTLAKDIEILNDFKASLKEVVESDSTTALPFPEKTLPLDSLLPTDQSFYRYSGSMSIEPCEESTERIVFKKPIKVTPSFFAELRKLKDKKGCLLKSSVNRLLQEVNGRSIYKSWQ